MPFLESRPPRGKGRIYFDVKGTGTPVLLIHGLGRSSRGWLGFDDLLASKYKVITMDNRGIARSSAASAGWTLSMFEMADDVRALCDFLKIESINVAGISFGGMIAMSFAMEFQRYVKSLIIMSSSIANWEYFRITRRGLKGLLKARLNLHDRHTYLAQHLLSKRDPNEVAQIVQYWEEIEREEGVPKDTVRKQLLAAIRFNVAHRLRSIKCRTMVICGSEDRFVPPENSAKIHKHIPGSELIYLDGAGHEIQADVPLELFEQISLFLG